VYAKGLREAYASGRPIEPIRDSIGSQDIDTAYRIQEINTRAWLDDGRRIVGRKIGLTSKVVQQQLGVDQPDYGILYADMEHASGEEVSIAQVLQPKIEAEVALVVNRDLDDPRLSMSALAAAVDCVLPALEIVGSRIADWNIGIVDTVADNASSGAFVLGLERRSLTGLDLELCGMVMTRNDAAASVGVGAACLGHPLNAALWLARKMAAAGRPLAPGDIVLTGALGPMSPVAQGDRFRARIAGLGTVEVTFSNEVTNG
jgi:2-keto-4-pentenoate hydratase